MRVRSYNDARLAYETLNWLDECPQTEKVLQRRKEQKIELRRFFRSLKEEPVIVQDYGDAVTLKFALPDFDSLDEADEWFMCHKYIDRPNSPYDCTGKAFTSWYSIYRMHGEWIAYHHIALDV